MHKNHENRKIDKTVKNYRENRNRAWNHKLCFVTLFFVIALIEKINFTPSQICCYVYSYTCSIVSIVIGKISISKLEMPEEELHAVPLDKEGKENIRFIGENEEEK